jgi:hypothetical protein
MRDTLVLFLLGVALLCAIPDAYSQNFEADPFMRLVASNEVQVLSNARTVIAEPSGYYSVQRVMYKVPQEPGQRMMKVGKILTAVGSALVITGILVYNNRDPNYATKGTFGTTYGDDPHEVGGQFLVGVGTGLIVPGVLIWIHGGIKFRKHIEKSTQALYIPAGKPGLVYRF